MNERSEGRKINYRTKTHHTSSVQKPSLEPYATDYFHCPITGCTYRNEPNFPVKNHMGKYIIENYCPQTIDNSGMQRPTCEELVHEYYLPTSGKYS